MISKITVTLCNNYKNLYAFKYPALDPIDSYFFNEPILRYYGVPLETPPNRTPAHIFIFNQTIKVAFKGTVTTVFNLTQTYGANAYCTAITNPSNSFSNNGDTFATNYTFN